MFALHEKLNKFTQDIQYRRLFGSNPKRVLTCKMNIKYTSALEEGNIQQ